MDVPRGRFSNSRAFLCGWFAASDQSPSPPALRLPCRARARTFASQGKLIPAENRYKEAIAVLENAFGSVHPQLAGTLIDLAEVMMKHEVVRAYVCVRVRFVCVRVRFVCWGLVFLFLGSRFFVFFLPFVFLFF